MNTHRTKRSSVLLLFLLISLLVGCASPAAPTQSTGQTEATQAPSSSSDSNSSADPADESSTPTEASAGTEGQTASGPADAAVNIGANEIVTLDPATGSGGIFTEGITNIYETLVGLDLDGNIVPGLASSWEYSDDGLTYTFHLQEGVTFHDGSLMKSSDVVYSINRMITMGQGFSYLISSYIQDVTAPDDTTVVFTLNQPFGPFIMCLLRAYIVSEPLVTANYDTSSTKYGDNADYGETWLAYNDAGTGPYTIKEILPQQSISLVANDNYWQGWTGTEPNAVNFLLVTEAATVRSLLSSAQLDFTDSYQSTESLKALDQLPGIDLATVDTGSILYLQMNTQKPPLDDVHVRKAIAHLIDYETLYATINNARPITGVVSSVVPGYSADVTTYEYSLEKAQEELALSKYADQLADYPIDLYWIDVVPDEQKVGLLIQSAAEQAGLKINLVQESWLAFTDEVANVDTTPALSLSFNSADYPEAGSILVSKFSSSTVGTWTQTEWLQDSQLDGILDEALQTLDTTARYELYAEAQKYISEIEPTVGVYGNATAIGYNSDRITWVIADRSAAGQNIITIPGDTFKVYDFIKIK